MWPLPPVSELFACGVVGLPPAAGRSLDWDPQPELNLTYGDYDYQDSNLSLTSGNTTGAGPTGAGPTGAGPTGAFYPTVATITSQDNQEQRIIGGNEAAPGEVPWQVGPGRDPGRYPGR